YEFEKDGKHFKCSVDVIDIDKKTIFIYLIDDITIIKNIEKERQRDEKLKLMGEMAANIAHEIRNPLGSIELYTSILKKSLKNNNDLNMTDSILKCTKAINNIISNILVFNRDVNIDIRKHYLADIIDDVVLYLRHLMLSKKIDFRNNIGEDTIVYADSEYLKQVIMNLLHNSIEATQEGGKIKIESKEDNYKTIICIEDNGCGIKPSFFDKLFIPFQTNKAKGTGLGLAICYKIIKAHRGSITPISDGESYTKFIVDLPKSEDYEK
ncbi:MAG: ATP-binding protein, partial [Deferribacterota bacterium]|nr:ATP-binding protein [Deferribacterota bacterium]